MLEKLFNDLVRYGDIVHDERAELNGAYTRITRFKMNGETYTVYMCNGRVLDIRKEGVL